MTYLLDTNAAGDIMRENPMTLNWLAATGSSDRVVTCTIVRGETLFGIQKLAQGRYRRELEEKFEAVFGGFDCEPIPARAADYYSALRVLRTSQGKSLEDNDLWIAATALAIDATLVTRDTDFAGIDGLRVIDLTERRDAT